MPKSEKDIRGIRSNVDVFYHDDKVVLKPKGKPQEEIVVSKDEWMKMRDMFPLDTSEP
ncbi:MAG: hypothetical protein WCO84_05155 [bacterium]